MKVLHFLPTIDISAGIKSKYMSTLASVMGNMVELHIACGKSKMPIEIKNATVHNINCKSSSPIRMRSEWLRLIYDIMPDIIHIHGCWTIVSARALMWAQERGFHTVLSPHGELEPWILKQQFWTNKLTALLFYQLKEMKRADAIHVSGKMEYDNFKIFRLNKNVSIINNSLITEGISDEEMASQMIEFYTRLLNTKAIRRINIKTSLIISKILHASITDNIVEDINNINDDEWRKIFLFARNTQMEDVMKEAYPLLPDYIIKPDISDYDLQSFGKIKNNPDERTSPYNVKCALPWMKKSIVKIIANDEKETKEGSPELKLCIMIMNAMHDALRRKLCIRQLYNIANNLRNNDYDESRLKKMIIKMHTYRFSKRLMQILHELTNLEEGFMPVPAINDFYTEKIRQLIINRINV